MGADLEIEAPATEEAGARFRATSREWRLVANQIHGMALGVAKDPAHAADLAQSVLACLVERGTAVVNVLAWARTALVRFHWKALRRQASTGPLVDAGALSVAPVAEPRVLLNQTLEQLSERDRRLLGWSYEGLTHREIAEQLGCRTGDVGTMLARARARARGLSRASGSPEG